MEMTFFTSGQHLLSLISDILDITRANAGTLTLDLRPVDLANLADKSLTLMNPPGRPPTDIGRCHR